MFTPREIASRAERLVGTPYKRLPGDLPEHKVLGITSSGKTITVADVEAVMNDAFLIDACRGPGEYSRLDAGNDARSRIQREIYEFAVALYGCEPVNLHGAGYVDERTGRPKES